MNSYKENYNKNECKIYDKCEKLMNYHAIFKMKDGRMFDGIIEHVDRSYVTVLVGEDMVDKECENQNNKRQSGFSRRYRRYRRRAIPLSSLIALSLLVYPYTTPPFRY
ncbi:hypothetical protein [Paraclostridium sordellii]|uniref:hypothetical protein n=1 Tax=Paraclostridium sordellii TaxID=1505 RepID=UPI001C61210A|nr:hypothetical protein [Paeniclostridium sordellii]QYE97988.1 hypothetical protein KZ987_17560 [Paeniclostridium sordellii]